MIPIQSVTTTQHDLISFPSKNLPGKICLSPFTTIEVDIRGNVRLCECAGWMPSTVGNLFQDSLVDILSNSQSAAVRHSIAKGTYQYCDETKCGVLLQDELILEEQIVQKHRDVIKYPEQWVMPHIIRIAGDLTCNLSCPSCRTEIRKTDNKQHLLQQNLGNILQKNLFARATEDHITLHVSTSGEIFASPMLMQFVNSISVDQFPNIELCIQSNGLLAEKNWHKLGSMQHRIGMITVTTDAATASTYEKLRRGGKWTDCQRALFFISHKKKSNGMKFVMRMVVQKNNYREMLQFYDQARELEADLVEYTRLQNWGTYGIEQFAENDVFDPAHTDYAAAQKMLNQVKQRSNVFLCGGIS